MTKSHYNSRVFFHEAPPKTQFSMNEQQKKRHNKTTTEITSADISQLASFRKERQLA